MKIKNDDINCCYFTSSNTITTTKANTTNKISNISNSNDDIVAVNPHRLDTETTITQDIIGNDTTQCAGSFDNTTNTTHATLIQQEQQEQHRILPKATNNYYGSVLLLGSCTVLLYADQNLMAPNLTAIANEFNMNDIDKDVKLGGNIAFAFFMIGAPASLLFGYLTDNNNLNKNCIFCNNNSNSKRSNRSQNCWCCSFFRRVCNRCLATTTATTMTVTNSNGNNDNNANGNYRTMLFVCTILVGSTFCFLTAFVQTYEQLFICRAMTGFGMGGAFPVSYSLLGDWFGPHQRHIVNSIYGIGTGAGIFIGQIISGTIGPIYGWRVPFIIVSIPCIVLSIVISFVISDPVRGGMEVSYNDQTTTLLSSSSESSSSPLSSQPKMGTAAIANVVTDNDIYPTSRNHSQYELLDQSDDNMELTCTHERSFPDSRKMTATATATATDTAAATAEYENSYYYSAPPHDDTDNTTTMLRSVQPLSSSSSSPHSTSTTAMVQTTSSLHDTINVLFSTPTVILSLLQGAPGCVPWGIVNTYLNDYLSNDHNMSVQSATFVVVFFGTGVFFGQLLSGVAGLYLYRIDTRYPSLVASISAICGCIAFWGLLLVVAIRSTATSSSTVSWIRVVPVSIIAGTASGMAGPIVKATLQNVTHPLHRGQAFALFNIADDFGRGLGPVFVASLIRSFGSRTKAFYVGCCGWIVCGIINGLVYFFVRSDEHRVQLVLLHEQQQQQQQQQEEVQQQQEQSNRSSSSSSNSSDCSNNNRIFP